MESQEPTREELEQLEQHLARMCARLAELETIVASKSGLSEEFMQRFREDAANPDKSRAFGEAELLFHLAEVRFNIEDSEARAAEVSQLDSGLISGLMGARASRLQPI